MADSREINKSTNTASPSDSPKQGKKNLKDAIIAKINRKKLSSAAPFCVNGAGIQIQNSSNVHVGNTVVASRSNPNAKPLEPKPEITPALSALFENDSEINNFHRLAVDCHVGSDWRFLGQELAGFSNGQMDQLEEPFKANQYPFREVIYQMLLMWSDHSLTKTTVGMLAKALWECKMYSAFLSLLEVVNDNSQK